jgi:hypothetical protein
MRALRIALAAAWCLCAESAKADTVSCPYCPEWTCEATYFQFNGVTMPETITATRRWNWDFWDFTCAFKNDARLKKEASDGVPILDARTNAALLCCGSVPRWEPWRFWER